jgi:hypothetical protein
VRNFCVPWMEILVPSELFNEDELSTHTRVSPSLPRSAPHAPRLLRVTSRQTGSAPRQRVDLIGEAFCFFWKRYKALMGYRYRRSSTSELLLSVVGSCMSESRALVLGNRSAPGGKTEGTKVEGSSERKEWGQTEDGR